MRPKHLLFAESFLGDRNATSMPETDLQGRWRPTFSSFRTGVGKLAREPYAGSSLGMYMCEFFLF